MDLDVHKICIFKYSLLKLKIFTMYSTSVHWQVECLDYHIIFICDTLKTFHFWLYTFYLHFFIYEYYIRF